LLTLEDKDDNNNKTVETFVNNAGNVNKGTAKEYKKRLRLFAQFINETYSLSLDELIKTLILSCLFIATITANIVSWVAFNHFTIAI
jgi:hypothetical protein